jgi:hypothetical protein
MVMVLEDSARLVKLAKSRSATESESVAGMDFRIIE